MRTFDAVGAALAGVVVASALAAPVAIAGIAMILIELWRELPASLFKVEYAAGLHPSPIGVGWTAIAPEAGQ